MRNIFIKIILFWLVLAISLVGAGKYLLNQQVIKQVVEDYLVEILQPWAEGDQLSIVLEDFDWGGVVHPLSFEVGSIDVKGLKNELRLEGKQIRVGLRATHLLLGKIQFSRFMSDHVILTHNNQSLLSGSLRMHPSWKGETLLIEGVGHDVGKLGSLLGAPFQCPDLHEIKFRGSLTFTSHGLSGNEISVQKELAQAYCSFTLHSDRAWIDLYRQGGEVEVKLTGHVKDLAVNDIGSVWPKELAIKPRAWVTQNIENGSVPLATLNMSAHLSLQDHGQIKEVRLSHLQGDIDAHGVTVHYLRPMLPVLQATGHCSYTDKQFLIEATGEVHGIKLTKGGVLITDLDQEDQVIDIQLENEGPLEKCLDLLKSEPLNLTRHLGIEGANVAGDATVATTLHFPLMMHLPLDQVEVSAQARLQNSQILFKDGMLHHFPLSQGNFDLHVTKDQFRLEGQSHIKGFLSTVCWEQYFEEKRAPYQQRLTIKSQIEWPQSERWGGRLPLDLHFEKSFKGISKGHVHADFDHVAMTIPWILWDKKVGHGGHGEITWSMVGNKGVIEKCDVIGPEIDVRGQGELDDQGLKSFQFSAFRIGDFKPEIHVTRTGSEFYRLKAHIAQLDLSALIHDLDALTQTQGDISVPAELAFDLKVDQLLVSDAFKMRDVHSDIRWVRDHLGLAEIKGEIIPDLKPFIFRLTPVPFQGRQAFNLQTSRAGEFLELFGTGYNMEGGHMVMVGHKDTLKETWALEGEVQFKDLVVRQAPLLAHLLSITSFQGIIHLLTGKGIHFSHGHGYFNLSPTKLTFNKAELSGPALGIFFEGYLSRLNDQVDFTGELVPIYGVNRLMANIPILGMALSGGHQEGIFRTAFTVTGNKKAPEVKVNALTSITPGGVRAAFKAGQKVMKQSQQ